MADPNDLGRIRRNIEKMIGQNAPEADIDAYLKSEGHTPDSFRLAQAQGPQVGPRPASGIGAPPDDRSIGRQAADSVGLLAQGLTDGIVDTAGMPVDAAAWALRKAGVPVGPKPLGGSESLRAGVDYIATLPGRVADVVTQGSFDPMTEARSARGVPQGWFDKSLYGAGRGVGGAASVIAPASMIAKTAGAVPTVGQRVATTLAAQPGTQVAMGAVGGAVGEATGDPLAGMAAGMATGFGPYMARRAITPQSILTPEEQRLAQAAVNEGIPLTVGQASGSKGWQLAESQLRKLPFSGNMAQRQFDEQRRAFNEAVLKRANIKGDRASPEIVDRAFDDVGAVYNDLIKRTGPIPVDANMARDVAGVVQNYGRRLSTDVASVFNSYVQDLAPAFQALAQGQNPQISAQVYQSIRSDIGRRARDAGNNPPLRDALYALQGTLDDAVARANPALASEWSDARRVYRNLLTIDSAMAKAPASDLVAGNVPFGAFRQAVRAGDAGGYARGRGEFNELSRVGGFLADRIPDSGTSQRNFMTGLLTGGAAGSMNPLLIGGVAMAPAAQSVVRRASTNYLSRLNNPQARPDAGSVNLLNDLFVRRLEGDAR